MTINFKGESNPVPQEWHDGFNDCLEYHTTWYTRRRELRGAGWYTNGWAEGNITAYFQWHEYWQKTLENRGN